MRPAAAGLTTRKKGDDRSSKVPEDAEEHEGMDKHGMRSLNRNICLTVGLIIAGTIAFVIYSSKPEIFAPTPQKLPAAVAKPTDASRNTSVHPVLHLPKASAAADRTSVSSAGSLKTEKPAEGLARHVHQSTPLVAVPAPRNHQEAAVPHSAPQSVTLPTAPFTPALVSLGRPATSNFKGNLAEPSVITNEKIDDWLKDRWQAAVDMSGTPYQGAVWVQIDLERPCIVSSMMVDWEAAYASKYSVEGRLRASGEHSSWQEMVRVDHFKHAKVNTTIATLKKRQHVMHSFPVRMPNRYATS
mmetsp:Transcript_24908/g.39081  ORF Transcript_24908/g.39081 Transcript_24908/m.39081 type:complete len:300 (-) Transcript_24908:546-1445(-)